MLTEDAYSSGHLVLSHIGTCSPEHVLFLDSFEFRTSLGISILLQKSLSDGFPRGDPGAQVENVSSVSPCVS